MIYIFNQDTHITEVFFSWERSRILLELAIANGRRLEFLLANECRLEVVYLWSAPKIRDLSILLHPIRFVYHCELIDKTTYYPRPRHRHLKY